MTVKFSQISSQQGSSWPHGIWYELSSTLHLYKFKDVENKKFQFVNVDVDLYQPAYDSFEFFFPRLVEGGVIHCDDYNICQFLGCKDAVDEYLKDKKVNLFYESPFGGCFIIK